MLNINNDAPSSLLSSYSEPNQAVMKVEGNKPAQRLDKACSTSVPQSEETN